MIDLGLRCEQLQTDIIYLARRQVAVEKALEEWSEFMTAELLKQGIQISKHKFSNRYYKESLKDKFKADYEKFESLFSMVNKLTDKKKGTTYIYNTIKEESDLSDNCEVK